MPRKNFESFHKKHKTKSFGRKKHHWQENKTDNTPHNIEKKELVEKLDTHLGHVARKLQNQGFPINTECRLDTAKFTNTSPLYSEQKCKIDEEDLARIQQKSITNQKKYEQEKNFTNGEKLEKLTTVLFHIFASQELTTIRTADYDDWARGIDRIVLDNNGEIVCTIDDVATTSGRRFQKKIARIADWNKHHLDSDLEGAELEYCVTKKDGKIQTGPLDKVPILYLALDKQFINPAIKDIPESLNPQDTNMRLKSTFLALIGAARSTILEMMLRIDKDETLHSEIFEDRLHAVDECLEKIQRNVENLRSKQLAKKRGKKRRKV